MAADAGLNASARAREVFLAALELDAEARHPFLERECASAPQVRARVLALLAARRPPVLQTRSCPGARAAILRESELPPTIGGYVLRERIGSGGMGVVYRAEQAFPGRTVALKLLRQADVDQTGLARFRNEVEMLGRLQHAAIAQVYDAGVVTTAFGDQPWFAMELVPGVPITRFAAEHRLDARARSELLAAVCDAVQHAHDRGVVHRDLKPGNILVAAGDAGRPQPKVLDFGVACSIGGDRATLTGTGHLVGTPSYMSPEQLAGARAVGASADVYALGVLLYELLAGQLPFELGEDGLAVFLQRVSEVEPRRLGQIDSLLRGDPETIAATALAKEPRQRYASARALAEDLRRWLQGQPIRARRPSSCYQLRCFARRKKALLGGVVATVLALALGIAAATRSAIRAGQSERIALSRAYAMGMQEALAIARTDPLAAEERVAAAAPELRGFEWHYLVAQLEQREPALPLPIPGEAWHEQCAIAYPAASGPLYARTRGTQLELIAVATGEIRCTLRTGAELSQPRLGADGTRVAALARGASDAVALVVWDTTTGRQILDLALPEAPGLRCSLRDDGHLAALAWRQGGAIVDIDSGRLVPTGPVPMLDHAGPPDPAQPAFLAGGSQVVHGNRVYDAGSGDLLRRGLGTDRVWQLVAARGSRLASVQWWDRSVMLLDGDGGPSPRHLPGLRGCGVGLVFSRDGRRLAAADTSGTVIVWDVSSGTVLRAFSAPARWLAFHPDGSKLAACTPEGPVEWALDDDEAQVLRGHDTFVYHVAYAPDGSLLASVDFHAGMVLWDPATGAKLATIRACHRPAPRFSADGQRITIPCCPRAWDTATGEEVAPDQWIAPGRPAAAPFEVGDWDAASPDGQLHASASERAVWLRTAAGEPLATLVLPAPDGTEPARVAASRQSIAATYELTAPTLAVSPDRRRIAVGHRNGLLALLDVESQRQLFRVPGHFGPVYGLAFSPDSRRIASGGNDGVVRLWDAQSLEQVGALRGHTSYVKAVAFRPDGKQLATASGDGTVRLWDTRPAKERHAAARAHAQARAVAGPRVRQMLRELGSRAAVAAALRSDPALDPGQRRAALQALLLETGGG